MLKNWNKPSLSKIFTYPYNIVTKIPVFTVVPLTAKLSTMLTLYTKEFYRWIKTFLRYFFCIPYLHVVSVYISMKQRNWLKYYFCMHVCMPTISFSFKNPVHSCLRQENKSLDTITHHMTSWTLYSLVFFPLFSFLSMKNSL